MRILQIPSDFQDFVDSKLKGCKAPFVISDYFVIDPDFGAVVHSTKIQPDDFSAPVFRYVKSFPVESNTFIILLN